MQTFSAPMLIDKITTRQSAPRYNLVKVLLKISCTHILTDYILIAFVFFIMEFGAFKENWMGPPK